MSIASIKDHSLVNNIMFAPQIPSPYGPNREELFYLGEKYNICCSIIQSSGRVLTEHDFLSSNYPMIVFCHGNAGNVGTTRDFACTLALATQCHVFFFDYPGYGLSSGISNESSACNSIRTVMKHVLYKMKIPSERCILYGQSIGTGIAAYGAKYVFTKYQMILGGLILMSPYLSIKTLANSITSFGSCILERLNTSEFITHCHSPLLIIHGKRDTLIPVAHGEKLLELATCPKFGWFPEDADHNYFDLAKLLDMVKRFITNNMGPHVHEVKYEVYFNITPRDPIVTSEDDVRSIIKSSCATSGELSAGTAESSINGCRLL